MARAGRVNTLSCVVERTGFRHAQGRARDTGRAEATSGSLAAAGTLVVAMLSPGCSDSPGHTHCHARAAGVGLQGGGTPLEEVAAGLQGGADQLQNTGLTLPRAAAGALTVGMFPKAASCAWRSVARIR